MNTIECNSLSTTAPIWQDNIISGGKSFSNKGPLNRAVDAVKAAIGMPPSISLEASLAIEQSVEQGIVIGAEK